LRVRSTHRRPPPSCKAANETVAPAAAFPAWIRQFAVLSQDPLQSLILYAHNHAVPQVASKRTERLEAISQIIGAEPIDCQETLVDRLAAMGFAVTQSSVSRDLRDLQVGKVRGRYVITKLESPPVADILSASTAGPNLIVLRTPIGAASMVAVRIDQADIPQIIGTIAGDDTIFIATENECSQRVALGRLGVKEHV